ncbi:SusE domain-containing protein [Persicobacter diffluens]
MKYGYKLMMLLLGSTMMFSACSEDNSFPRLDPEVAVQPGFDHTFDQSEYVLTKVDESGEVIEDNTWQELSWDAAQYGLEVVPGYKVQVVVEDQMATVLETAETSAAISIKQINNGVLAAGVAPEATANVTIKIQSDLAGQRVLFSEEVTTVITTYNPEPPHIFKVGSENGWNNPDADDFAYMKLYEQEGHEDKLFENTIKMKNGEEFKFVLVDGSWDAQVNGGNTTVYAAFNSISGDDNFKYTGESGDQLLTVEFVAENEYKMFVGSRVYMVGSANDWNKPEAERRNVMEIEDGVYKITQKMTKGEQFKLVYTLGDWNDQLNGSNFSNTTDPNFSGDDNISFSGNDGVYEITFDTNEGTITSTLVD